MTEPKAGRETARICQFCRHFRDRDGYVVEESRAGYCWRYPPVIVWSMKINDTMRDRPVMSPWEWCGEYQ